MENTWCLEFALNNVVINKYLNQIKSGEKTNLPHRKIPNIYAHAPPRREG